MPQNRNELGSRQKVAVLLLTLPVNAVVRIYEHLSDEDIESITLEIARLGRVENETRDLVINEFREMCLAQAYIAEGGLDHAKRYLESAFGPERAEQITNRVIQAMQVIPFGFVKKTDPGQLLNFIQDEHPQTIALILAYLKPSQAAAVLSGLPAEVRAEVARRIAIMDRTPPAVIKQVEGVLERKLSSVISQEMTSAGGIKSLVEVLNWVDRSTERTILESMQEDSPDLAEEIKKLMFVFEDIVSLDDRSIQQVLKEVESKELALALKGVNPTVQERIFKNMSERAATMLREDMEFMGPVKLRSVEEAQQRVVNIIRRLEEAGEIIVSRGAGDDEVVV